MKTALLVPVYQPGENVLPFLSEFREGEFDFFLVVDDGSGEKYRAVFDEIRSKTRFDVLSYPVNKGKGNALKEGMKKLLIACPDLDFIVTADGDGQHLRKDILNLRKELENHPDELLLGSRDFASPDVPGKSRKGNRFSVFSFRLLTGVKLKDTQTGLRAIPKTLFPLALETEGSRYEYENNFLLAAVKECKVTEIDIETVYEKGNASSHFRPFRDSLRIARRPLLYILTSVASWLLDLGIFSLVAYVFFSTRSEMHTAVSTIAARVLSGTFNFLMLRYVVFRGKENTLRSALKYLLLFIINMALSAGITAIFTSSAGNFLTVLKIVIDALIAIANYFINRLLVFSERKKKGERK